jgi:tetratricopeptide (TPR) repeat protein
MRGLSATLNNLGAVACDMNDFAAAEKFHNENLAIKRSIGDRLGIAATLNNLGYVAIGRGDYDQAQSLLEESLEITRELGARSAMATTLHALGTVQFERTNLVGARRHYGESLALFIELGERGGIAYTRGQVADLEIAEGNLAEAERLAKEADRIFAETADQLGLALSAGRLAEIAMAQQRNDLAGNRLRTALELAQERNYTRALLGPLETAARLATVSDRADQACRLLGFTTSTRSALRLPLAPIRQRSIDELARSLTDRIGDPMQTEDWQLGANLSLDGAVELALNLLGPTT